MKLPHQNNLFFECIQQDLQLTGTLFIVEAIQYLQIGPATK